MNEYDMSAAKGGVYMDVLREIGNIGAGNATTALAQMVNCKIDMDVPQVKILSFNELAQVFGGPEKPVIGVLFNLSMDVDGMMLFVLDEKSAKSLANLLLMGTSEGEELTEMDISTLREVGNIISGAYVYSLSEMTNMTIWTSVPYLARDMAGAVLSVPAIEIAKTSDEALIIETVFKDGDNDIGGYFILIPEQKSFDDIMTKLGVK
jgi:chemotaxis protein CheC